MSHNPFDAPPEGAMPTAIERALSVQYKANKTPQAYAKAATDTDKLVENLALGFQYYDKEQGKKIALPEFTFVVLEIYAGVDGYNDETKVSYWSSRALDTRTDILTVYASGTTSAIARGLYQDIKADLPHACKYQKFVKAYCVQLDRVVEIKLSQAAERGMQKAIAEADTAAGRKTQWFKVFILGLAQSDHLWGFHLNGYTRTHKNGDEYSGTGELFFEPKFYAGIVNPTKSADLHAKCVDLQAQERKAHEQYQQRHADATVEAQPSGSNPVTQPNQPDPSFPTDAPPPADGNDDLPF